MKNKILLAVLCIGFFAVNAAEAGQQPSGGPSLPPVVGTPPNGQPAPQIVNLCYDIKAITNRHQFGKSFGNSRNQKVVLSVKIGDAKAQDFQLLSPELLCLQGTSKPKSNGGNGCFGNQC